VFASIAERLLVRCATFAIRPTKFLSWTTTQLPLRAARDLPRFSYVGLHDVRAPIFPQHCFFFPIEALRCSITASLVEAYKVRGIGGPAPLRLHGRMDPARGLSLTTSELLLWRIRFTRR